MTLPVETGDGQGSTAGRPLCAVVILNWNRWRDTIACLRSVLAQEVATYRLVVVDNGSSDDSFDRLLTWATGGDGLEQDPVPRMHVSTYDTKTAIAGGRPLDERLLAELPSAQCMVLVRAARNLGFTGGCNVAISYAIRSGAAFVLLLNNDAQLAPGSLHELSVVAAESGAAIVGARVFDAAGRHLLSCGRTWPMLAFLPQADRPPLERRWWSTDVVDGCAMLIRCELLRVRIRETRHALDPRFFLYWEDADLCLYAQSRGYTCVIARDALVYHAVGLSSGGMFNPRSYYYGTRNRIFMADRWLPGRLRWFFHVWYVPSRMVIVLGRLWARKTAAAQAIVLGLLDGYRGQGGQQRERSDVSLPAGSFRAP